MEYGEPMVVSPQWKGIDFCGDWFCASGHQNHTDDFTFGHIKCEECGEEYFLPLLLTLSRTDQRRDADGNFR